MTGEAFPDSVRRLLAARSPVLHERGGLLPASVLVPLFAPSPQGTPEVWLVRRADDLRVHSGQVALPGGKKEPTDTDLLTTALREAEEEIGLAPAEVDVLGQLDDCVTVTGFVVTPFVGWIAQPFTPRPLAMEVARVFALPLSTFERPTRTMRVGADGHERVVFSYEAGGETIWGTTARILAGFSDLLRA
ncbi:MAG TPA: CoA pyrophosphatase [Polyangiaceae bacterium]|jgi:8-oxo-dGTP pyrophosphatase MutT (NUDIX family)